MFFKGLDYGGLQHPARRTLVSLNELAHLATVKVLVAAAALDNLPAVLAYMANLDDVPL